MDYRAERMIEHIKRAFLACLSRKGFPEIIVSDIAKEAKINRSTFYRYFEDKYALRDAVIDEKIRFFVEHMASDFLNMDIRSDGAYSQELYQSLVAIHEGKEEYLLLWRSRDLGRLVFEEMIQAGARKMETEISKLSLFPEGRLEMAQWYAVLLTNNMLVTIRWWFENDRQYTPEDITAMMLAHMQHGTIPTLKGRSAEK